MDGPGSEQLTGLPGAVSTVPRSEPVMTGHRDVPLGASPFGPTLPGVLTALVFGAACLVWLAAGDRLPGGRWIVVHMFTLGVLTPLIWTFSRHFAVRFTGTRARATRPAVRLVLTLVLGGSVVAMLVGRAVHAHVPLALGSAGIMLVVGVNLVALRRIRRQSTTARFVWVVRQYEYAHAAFLLAAGLGGALGAGWVPGTLFTAARDAHIHLNVLGWAGLTVLATLVPFGPALLRARTGPRAEARAAVWLPAATLGLAVAAAGFLLASVGGGAGPIRLLTVGGLATYGWAVVAVAHPLWLSSRTTDRSPLRWMVAASLGWFVVAIATALVRAVLGVPGWSRALAPMLLLGVLAQLVLAVLAYITPMLRGRDFATRDRLLARLEHLARIRAGTLNLGVLMLATTEMLGRILGPASGPLAQTGWILVGLGIVSQITPLLRPTGSSRAEHLYSRTAARYRATDADLLVPDDDTFAPGEVIAPGRRELAAQHASERSIARAG
jgi:uncharacterized membrane protein YuzA (DUF378 family)